MGYNEYKQCIEACLACAAICDHCATSCLKEENVQMMTKCVQLDMECATICYATARLLSLGSDQAAMMCTICADICDACAAECSKHSHDHCAACAKACKHCADECRRMNVS
jgi:hypothetical protein